MQNLSIEEKRQQKNRATSENRRWQEDKSAPRTDDGMGGYFATEINGYERRRKVHYKRTKNKNLQLRILEVETYQQQQFAQKLKKALLDERDKLIGERNKLVAELKQLEADRAWHGKRIHAIEMLTGIRI